MALYHELVASYRLRLPSRALKGTKAARLQPKEAGLYDAITKAAGKTPSNFGYDVPAKKRELSWYFKSSREARAAEARIRALRRHFKRSLIRTKVIVSRAESLEETKKKYSITPGQYKRLMREGSARQCEECHQCLPKYHGRYPKDCPECGGHVGMPIDEEDDDKRARRKRYFKRTGTGAAIGATLGTVAGAASGKPGTSAGLRAARGALGFLAGDLVGGGAGSIYHAVKERKKKKKLKDSLEFDGASLDEKKKDDEEDDEKSDARHARLKKRAAIGGAIGTAAGAGVGSSVAGPMGAVIGSELGGAAGAGYGTLYHAIRERKKKKKIKETLYHSSDKRLKKDRAAWSKKESLKDSIGNLINGRPLNYVIDELLQDKYDESSQHSSQSVD